MSKQLHRQFTNDQIELLLELYDNKTITLVQVLNQLGCARSRFYELLKAYRAAPEDFSIAYARHKPQHRLSERVDRVIREELAKDKQLISDKDMPVWLSLLQKSLNSFQISLTWLFPALLPQSHSIGCNTNKFSNIFLNQTQIYSVFPYLLTQGFRFYRIAFWLLF